MIYTQPVTMEYIESGNWFLFGGVQNNNTISIVVASLIEIVDSSLLIASKNARDNELFYFKTVDVLTLKKCKSFYLSRYIIETQVDKGVYKMIEFDDENEEAKFRLITA